MSPIMLITTRFCKMIAIEIYQNAGNLIPNMLTTMVSKMSAAMNSEAVVIIMIISGADRNHHHNHHNPESGQEDDCDS